MPMTIPIKNHFYLHYFVPINLLFHCTVRQNTGDRFNFWKFVESKNFIAHVSILGSQYKILDLYVVSKDFPCSNTFVMRTHEMSLKVVTALKVAIFPENPHIKLLKAKYILKEYFISIEVIKLWQRFSW